MIYLDHAAATPVDKRVFAAMKPYFIEQFGNPSSLYKPGRVAKAAVDEARQKLAKLMGASSRNVIFTGGGTESCNLALFGVVEASTLPVKHIIISKTEHDAVLAAAYKLEAQGVEVTYLDVDADGLIDLVKLEASIKPNTVLVSIGFANNEIGVVQDLVALGGVCRRHGVLLHTDACQAAPYYEINLRDLPVDLVSINASKIYGPKGIGALVIGNSDVDLLPQIMGGAQEFGLRSGTENVPGIVGLASAYELACAERVGNVAKLTGWRDYLIRGLVDDGLGIKLTGSREHRLPNHVSVIIGDVEGESLLMRLEQEGICVSTGAACSSGSLEVSHVLEAIGVSENDGYSALRLTLGELNNEKQVEEALGKIKVVIEALRGMVV